mmetsp:Transcript_25864/g.58309  ORF Transcript_25864/g.58309 Transcript_25864/m.58309 type:complete len:223 (-) Transcript_25864:1467-2135(-)
MTLSMVASVSFPSTTSSVITSTVSSLYLLPPLAPPNLMFSSGVRVSSPKKPPGCTTRLRRGYSSDIISTAPCRTMNNAGSSTQSPSMNISLSRRNTTVSMSAVSSSYSKSSRSVSRRRGTERRRRRSRDRRIASERDPTTFSKWSFDIERMTVRSRAVAVQSCTGGCPSPPPEEPFFPPPSFRSSSLRSYEMAFSQNPIPGPRTLLPVAEPLSWTFPSVPMR